MVIKLKDSSLSIPNPTRKYTLVFSRKSWESEMLKANGYSFSKDELDKAEKLQTKLIGNRKGVDCYLRI